jgi:DNA-directed RNA polymerase specialized sigma24 family protein
MSDDTTLLRAFVEKGSEQAFTELVNRYVHAVYAAALRTAGNPSLAEEATQAMFCLLARRAHSLSARTPLIGWLHRTAWHLANKALRTEPSSLSP